MARGWFLVFFLPALHNQTQPKVLEHGHVGQPGLRYVYFFYLFPSFSCFFWLFPSYLSENFPYRDSFLPSLWVIFNKCQPFEGPFTEREGYCNNNSKHDETKSKCVASLPW